MTSEVKKRVIASLNTHAKQLPSYQAAVLQGLVAQIALYERNAHGMTTEYQLSGLIYLRYLRKMSKPKTNEVDHSQRAHALLSASSATQWLNCTPSPRLQEGFKNESSSFAEEGTLAHELAEVILKIQIGLINTEEYSLMLKPIEASQYFSQSMIDYVQVHVDYVEQQFQEAKRKTPDAVLLIEERVDITHLIENGFGTCDVIIIADGTLEVIDLKYGLGVRVDATDNSQLKLYGSGALEAYEMLYDIHTVKLTVTQPRMDSISSWEISADDLRKWGQEVVKPTAVIAYAGEGEQKPGEWCRFCRASPRCKAQADLAKNTIIEAFIEPNLLTDAQLIEIFSKIPQVDKWFKSISEFVYNEARDGKKWEGFKMVDGQNRRGWADEEAAKEVLYGSYKLEEFTTTKIKGIGDIEKLVGKNNFPVMLGDHVAFKKTSPSLVPDSDKRQAIDQSVELNAFDDSDDLN
jgi:hypothetical protein